MDRYAKPFGNSKRNKRPCVCAVFVLDADASLSCSQFIFPLFMISFPKHTIPKPEQYDEYYLFLFTPHRTHNAKMFTT